MNVRKPRVIRDFDRLSTEIQEQIKLTFPYGFAEELISFTDKDGKFVSALPFETDDKYYLVRMTVSEAIQLVEEDDDYDDEGTLKDDAKNDYSDKYSDINYIAENLGEEDDMDD